VKSVSCHFDAHNNYSNTLSLNINMPATCHVLSMGTRVPPIRLPWYYPVGQCSTWRYPGTRWVPGYGTRVPDKLPDRVPG